MTTRGILWALCALGTLYCVVEAFPRQYQDFEPPQNARGNFRGLQEREFRDMEMVVRQIKKNSARRMGRASFTDDGNTLIGDIALTLKQACVWLANQGGTYDSNVQRICNGLGRQKRKIIDYTIYTGNKWEQQIYYRNTIYSTLAIDTVENAVAFWTENSCLDFIKADNSYSGKMIEIIDAGGCWSYLGKTGDTVQQMSLGVGCLNWPGIAIHEFGHALGMVHEQTRQDRDSYVKVDTSLISSNGISQYDIPGYTSNYNTPYDYGSVMHYGSSDFCTTSCSSTRVIMTAKRPYSTTMMGNRVKGSFLDILALNRAYDCPNKCTSISVSCQNGGFPNYRTDCTTCHCPEGFGGSDCSVIESQVGSCYPNQKELQATPNEQCIYNSAHPQESRGTRCSWRITASGGNVLVRFIDAFSMAAYDRSYTISCHNYVEIKNDTSDWTQRGMRFCGSSAPSFPGGYLDTQTNQIVVHYSAEQVLTDKTALGGAFKLCYKTEGDSICASAPCKNNGVCSSDGTTFSCNCANTGYTGQTCETAISGVCTTSNPCQNGGVCQSSDGVTATCDCSNTDYTGSNCEIYRVCLSNPCQNNGRCITNNDIDYTCDCTNTGYTGNNCQTPGVCIASSPCQNGGICSSTDGSSYTCDCSRTDYTGNNCEIYRVCLSNPCQNNGRCITNNDIDYTCDCTNTGYTGSNCQTPGVCIASNPCQNGGICSSTDGSSYTCDCSRTDYVGQNCEIYPVCNSQPCQNNGICITNDDVTYRCDCTNTGYYGNNCENAGVCLTSNPCNNGGECLSSDGTTYRCDCSGTGYSGPTCDDQSPCASNPCLNGGACLGNSDGSAYVCDCRGTGYTGTNCETGANPCSPNPCYNGGICSLRKGRVRCRCRRGYTGTYCERRKTYG